MKDTIYALQAALEFHALAHKQMQEAEASVTEDSSPEELALVDKAKLTWLSSVWMVVDLDKKLKKQKKIRRFIPPFLLKD